MTLKEQIIQEIQYAPEALLQSCLEFIRSKKAVSDSLSVNAPIPSDKSLWEIADKIIATIPEESFDKLPTDAAANIDHYLYGNTSQD